MIKALIFDFDGVILDSVDVKTKAFASMYSKYGSEVEKKVIKYHLLHGGISRFEKFKYFHKNFLGKKINETEMSKLASQFSRIVFEKVCSSNYIKGALPLLNFCKNKYHTFICTGTPENEILRILEKKKLDSFFDHVYGSPKSKVEIIKNILNEYNINSDQALFIGDAMTDYIASKNTKVKFIGVKNNETNFPDDILTVEDLEKIIEFL